MISTVVAAVLLPLTTTGYFMVPAASLLASVPSSHPITVAGIWHVLHRYTMVVLHCYATNLSAKTWTLPLHLHILRFTNASSTLHSYTRNNIQVLRVFCLRSWPSPVPFQNMPTKSRQRTSSNATKRYSNQRTTQQRATTSTSFLQTCRYSEAHWTNLSA